MASSENHYTDLSLQQQPEQSPPELVSLENFDPKNKFLAINSPRSIESCLREGIDPQELFELSEKQLIDQFNAQKHQARNLTKDQFKNFIDSNRQKKIDIAIRRREAMIRQEEKGCDSESMKENRSFKSGANTTRDSEIGALQAREQEMIERIKVKQKKEIMQMLNNEYRVEEIKQKAVEKQSKILEKEKMRDHIFFLHKKQAEIKQKKIQVKLMQKDELDKMKSQELEQKSNQKEREAKMKSIQKEAIRKGLSQQREEWRQQKRQKLEEQLRQSQLLEEQKYQEKIQQLSKKQEIKKSIIHNLQEQKLQELEHKQQLSDQRLNQVRALEHSKSDQTRNWIKAKEDENIFKQMEFAHIKESYLSQLRLQNQQRSDTIRKNLEKQEQERWQRNFSYYQKYDNLHRQNNHSSSQLSLDSSQVGSREFGRASSARSMNLCTPQAQNKISQGFISILDERAEYVRQMQLLQQKQRGAEEELKNMQVMENLKMVEKKRHLVMSKNIEKIEAVKEKLEQRDQQREKMSHIRCDMAKMANSQKEQLNEQFQKRSKNANLDLHTLASIYGICGEMAYLDQLKPQRIIINFGYSFFEWGNC